MEAKSDRKFYVFIFTVMKFKQNHYFNSVSGYFLNTSKDSKPSFLLFSLVEAGLCSQYIFDHFKLSLSFLMLTIISNINTSREIH